MTRLRREELGPEEGVCELFPDRVQQLEAPEDEKALLTRTILQLYRDDPTRGQVILEKLFPENALIKEETKEIAEVNVAPVEQPRTSTRRNLLKAGGAAGLLLLLGGGIHGVGSAIDAEEKARTAALEKQIEWEKKAYELTSELFGEFMELINYIQATDFGKNVSLDIKGLDNPWKLAREVVRILDDVVVKGKSPDLEELSKSFKNILTSYEELKKKVEDIYKLGKKLNKHLKSFDRSKQLDVEARKDEFLKDYKRRFKENFVDNVSGGMIEANIDEEDE